MIKIIAHLKTGSSLAGKEHESSVVKIEDFLLEIMKLKDWSLSLTTPSGCIVIPGNSVNYIEIIDYIERDDKHEKDTDT